MKYYIATSLLRITDHNLVREALKGFGHGISLETVYEADYTLKIHRSSKKRATGRSPWLSHSV
jgi:hypothetical protein